jgi:hypothetical protein
MNLAPTSSAEAAMNRAVCVTIIQTKSNSRSL